MNTTIPFGTTLPFPRHALPGYYALSDLPDQANILKDAMSTGWDEMDKILKIYPTQLVVVTGSAGSGKSTFLYNLLIRLCTNPANGGKRSWLYIPENEINIVEKMEGLFASKNEFSKFASQMCFVQSSNYEHYNDDPRDIEWILERAYTSWQKDKIDFVMIDPWNELERAKQKDELLTDYIGRCLMRVKMFAKTTGCTVFMVAHPTKAANGREVTLADIEGSMNWFNKCDNGLIVKRNPLDTIVFSAKVRQQPQAGHLGHCIFLVDPQTGVFREQVGGGQIL